MQTERLHIALPRSLLERIERRYDQLVGEALAYREALPPLQLAKPGRRGRKKRRPGHNLAQRLRDRRESVWRFLRNFTVPFANNQAEQDLRMMKLRMKISGFGASRVRTTSPRCAACCRPRGSRASTASRPCCKGPTPCSRKWNPSRLPDVPIVRSLRSARTPTVAQPVHLSDRYSCPWAEVPEQLRISWKSLVSGCQTRRS